MARLNNNLAYDYSELEEPELVEVPKIKHKKITKRKANELPTIGWFSLAVIALTILCSIMFGQVELSKLTTEQSELKSQLSQIQDENVNLEAQLAAKTGVTIIEDYAENSLGLTKLDKSQVEYVEIPPATVSEVVEKEDDGFFSSIKKMFDSAKEYLGIE